MNLYPWFIYLHLIGVLIFVLAHGASVMVALRLRIERNPERVRALLDLSSGSIGVMYIGLLVLLVGGIAAGFAGGHWGQLWIWTAIAVLVAVLALMYARGTQYYAMVRQAVGIRPYNAPKDAPDPVPSSPEDLDALLSSGRAFELAGIGGVGLLVLTWLMVAKPF